MFEEEFVLAKRQFPNDAGRIRIGHLLRIDEGILPLLRGGILQAEASGASIPEISAVEVALSDVVLERREICRIHIALWVVFGDPVVGVSPCNRDGYGSGIGSASEHAENGRTVAISSGGIVTETASQVTVDRQVGIENLEFAESLNLVERIEGSGLRGCQGLIFQASLFGANADEVGIIFDEALYINPVMRQDAGQILLGTRIK